jgi:hypothetical protein
MLKKRNLKKAIKRIKLFYKVIETIKRLWKIRKAYRLFQKQRVYVRKLQKWYKRRYAEKVERKRRRYIILIQTYIRMYREYKVYNFQSMGAVTKIQALFRGKQARNERRRLDAIRMELKVMHETGLFKRADRFFFNLKI